MVENMEVEQQAQKAAKYQEYYNDDKPQYAKILILTERE